MRETVPAIAVQATALLLCLFTAGCDPETRRDAARTTEPRLTSEQEWRRCREPGLQPGNVVVEIDCGSPNIAAEAVSVACDAMINDHATALQALVSRPRCTDAAVDALSKLAAYRDARVWSDLAAAYVLRAQRDDRPSDLLRALDAAERAVEIAPDLREARFNRALAQEALQLDFDAMQSWDVVGRLGEAGWSTDAAERRARLLDEASAHARARWDSRRVARAVLDGDGQTVTRLVRSFPAAAQKYLEEEVLPAWARAADRRPDEAERQLAIATAVAVQIERATGDPYTVDAVEVIRTATDPARRKMLQEGHLAFSQGRLDQARKQIAATVSYGQAEQAFTAAGSSFRHGARIGRAITTFFASHDPVRARELLPDTAIDPRYLNVLMRVASNSGFFLFYESRHTMLAEYDLAIGLARRMGDRENIANFHVRKAGILRVLGSKDAAWREALQALRLERAVVDVSSRHHLLGEAASIVLQHGFPAIALQYQNKAVRLLETALSHPPELLKPEQRDLLRNNLASALRNRAQIELHLGHHLQAQKDLDSAIAHATKKNASDDIARNALLARIHQVEGQSAMGANDPARAVSAFTAALARLFPGEYRAYRAMLYAERADAYTRLGRRDAAIRDLGIAVQQIRAEEQLLLEQRKRGRAEELMAGYFSRPREVYERLIRMLIEHGRAEEAFAYAERARAFEPLTLAMDADVLPDTIDKWVRRGDTLPLESVRRALPAGTILVEYYLLDDRLYVWLVSRDHFELLTRPLRRETVDRWSAAIHRHAAEGNAAAAQVQLEEAFDGLLAEPLAKIRAMAPAEEQLRLVFVPDRSLYGLPWAALRDRGRSRFLIEDYPVSIAASATFYVLSLIRDQELASNGARSVLLIADPAFNPRLSVAQGLGRLQWARREAARIAALYDAPLVREGAEATAEEFLALVPESAIVHFTGHAVASPDAPFRSLLLLAPSQKHDGVLDANELLTRLLPGKTRLCILAACSSAGQVPIGPEGLAPLVRPLIAAGIPAVVGTLWEIKDETSEELFVLFHRYYRDGHDADKALRLAQLEMMTRDNDSLSSILAWAPAQVVGYASSPFRSNNAQKEE